MFNFVIVSENPVKYNLNNDRVKITTISTLTDVKYDHIFMIRLTVHHKPPFRIGNVSIIDTLQIDDEMEYVINKLANTPSVN